jgi:hypothetical protein
MNLLVTIAVIFLVVINLGDQDIRPEVKEALVWHLPDHSLEDNGYLILKGIDAPLAQDAYQVGRKELLDELIRFEILQKKHSEPVVMKSKRKSPYPEFKELYCDSTVQADCVDFYLKQSSENLTSLQMAQRILTERFKAIKQSKNYIEVVPPIVHGEIPAYQDLWRASELQRIQGILDIKENRQDLGMQRLLENALFSRKLLYKSKSLVSHLTALSMIQRDLRIISELCLHYPEFSTKYKNQLGTVLQSISDTEYSIAPAILNHQLASLQLIYHLNFLIQKSRRYVDIKQTLFYQGNSTLNLIYDQSMLWIRLAEASPKEINKEKEKILQTLEEWYGFGIAPYYIRNPIGKIMNQVGEADFTGYIERHHDTEGHIRLVKLQLQFLSGEVSKDKIQQTLSLYPDPYTLKPMQYDENEDILIFNGRYPANVNFGKSKIYKVRLH